MKPTISPTLKNLRIVPIDVLETFLYKRNQLELSLITIRGCLAMLRMNMAQGVYDPASVAEYHRALFDGLQLKEDLDKYFATLN